MEIKHSIIMICYNQEQYIRTALDSVLCEQVKPYEIIIGDDFSTDGTREILQEYKAQYPEIIKLVLNESNLGIFGNLNSISKKATGDVISILPGDDWFSPNLLEFMNRKIDELNLNPKLSKFMLLPHTVLHQPDGSERRQKNDSNILARFSPVGAVLRNKLYTRHMGLSCALFNEYPPYPPDFGEIGPWADFIQHITFAQHINKLVVMNCDGPVYRVGVGIASRAGGKELARSFQRALIQIQSHYLQGELKLNELDAKYLEFLIACGSVSLDFSLAGVARFFGAAWRVLKIDISEIGIVGNEIMRTLRRIASLAKRKSRNATK